MNFRIQLTIWLARDQGTKQSSLPLPACSFLAKHISGDSKEAIVLQFENLQRLSKEQEKPLQFFIF